MENQKVWFVTGASKGLGLTLVKKLIDQGFSVAATSRRLNDLEKEVGKHEQFLPLEVDLSNEASVSAALTSTISKFGRIDVVVNNAGYGLVGGLDQAPLHPFLGDDAYQMVDQKIKNVVQEMEVLKALATSTAFSS